MLFYVAWKPRSTPGTNEKALEVFSRWQPPKGFEFQGIWGRADGGGFCVCEASTAEVMFEATSAWAGVLLDYEIVPIVPIEKAVELGKKAIAFRNG
jgi:hypothetical protein